MSVSENDKKFVWHPFTQAKTATPPIVIKKAEGVWLYDEEDQRYLDVNSSWWTNIHGHGNKYIASEIRDQFLQLDHVIFAGVTHPKAVELSERIIELLGNHFGKVFFSDNGSTSVEVAIKMVYQYWYNQGKPKKRFLAIEGAYHGDTFGAMSVGQRGNFNQPFEHLFFEVDFIPFPTAENSEQVLKMVEEFFAGGEFAGFIFEPIIQGAAGMRIYDSVWLDQAVSLAKKYEVRTIADEVMTGFYRTGTCFAIDRITNKPDIICLSKGLTGGVLPLGLTVATDEIYNAFLSDETGAALLHGHSFTGNPLVCAAACASIDLLTVESNLENVSRISAAHTKFMTENLDNKSFQNINSIGTILSISLKTDSGNSYFQEIRNKAYNYFLERGFLIRPLGNVIFVNPPYCITDYELESVYQVILDFSEDYLKSE